MNITAPHLEYSEERFSRHPEGLVSRTRAHLGSYDYEDAEDYIGVYRVDEKYVREEVNIEFRFHEKDGVRSFVHATFTPSGAGGIARSHYFKSNDKLSRQYFEDDEAQGFGVMIYHNFNCSVTGFHEIMRDFDNHGRAVSKHEELAWIARIERITKEDLEVIRSL